MTTLDADGAPVGFTATSLASLSAVPPTATFNMAQTASTWPAIQSAERVIIHLLGVRNQPQAQQLSGPRADRFDGDHWEPGPHGLPLLRDVTAWMVGRIVSRIPIQQAAIVAVQIEEGGLGGPDDPLLYHERRYSRPEPFILGS